MILLVGLKLDLFGEFAIVEPVLISEIDRNQVSSLKMAGEGDGVFT